jgi:hypothetical protein
MPDGHRQSAAAASLSHCCTACGAVRNEASFTRENLPQAHKKQPDQTRVERSTLVPVAPLP